MPAGRDASPRHLRRFRRNRLAGCPTGLTGGASVCLPVGKDEQTLVPPKKFLTPNSVFARVRPPKLFTIHSSFTSFTLDY
jgi:hypothetical protein